MVSFVHKLVCTEQVVVGTFYFWSVDLVSWGKNENFNLKLLFLHPLEKSEVRRIGSGVNPKKSIFRMSNL